MVRFYVPMKITVFVSDFASNLLHKVSEDWCNSHGESEKNYSVETFVEIINTILSNSSWKLKTTTQEL